MALPRLPPLVLLLAFAGAVLVTAAVLRDPEYDEGYTAAVTATVARPDWPRAPFRAADGRDVFRPAPTPWAIAANLRRTDVHPPLYFWLAWAWRRCLGPSLFATRLLSVAFSLGALALVAAIAAETRLPVMASVLLTLGCYGFVETGIVARGYAMAQCMTLGGLLLTLRARRPRGIRPALWAGLLLGAACLTNYLAAFPTMAALLWTARIRPWRLLALLTGLLPFILGDLSFFMAQRGSRIGQFEAFGWVPIAVAMARSLAGAMLGGLPLYCPPGAWRLALSVLLGMLLLALLVASVPGIRRVGSGLPAMAALATPAGLLVMGLASHSQPVEIRYFAFALPPLALLIAAGLCRLPNGAWLLLLVLAVQGAAIAGLIARPETMQPEGAAARAAYRAIGDRGLALLPIGDDGVGLVSAFLNAAPAGLHILLVRPDMTGAAVCATVDAWPGITTADIAVDRSSKATLPLLRTTLGHCTQMR
jgi:Dolichyl-phosphate-mannose-protein mannosyltransferase